MRPLPRGARATGASGAGVVNFGAGAGAGAATTGALKFGSGNVSITFGEAQPVAAAAINPNAQIRMVTRENLKAIRGPLLFNDVELRSDDDNDDD
jgi:hypothetical protein